MFVVAFLAVGLLLFVRPFQVLVLTPIIGARRPTHEEAALIEPIWADIADANGLPAEPLRRARRRLRRGQRVRLRRPPRGRHHVRRERTDTEPSCAGVLAHELSHHLGLHTVAITFGHWLSAPGRAARPDRASTSRTSPRPPPAASASAPRSSPPSAESVAAVLFSGLAWVFTAAIRGQRRGDQHGRPLLGVRGRPARRADGLRRRTGGRAALRAGARVRRPTDRMAGATRRVAPARAHAGRPHRSADAPPRPLTADASDWRGRLRR